MARKISPRVADRDEALRALDAAADLAAEAQARGEAGSNVDAFVDATLRRLAALTAEGRLDAAAAAADSAVGEAEAGLVQLLDAAIRQHLLAFDAEGAARQIVRRLTLEMTDPSACSGPCGANRTPGTNAAGTAAFASISRSRSPSRA